MAMRHTERSRDAQRRDRPRAEEPAPPAAAPEAMLALQRGAGNAAVARLLARAPAGAVETAGHEEASWARPSPTLAEDPVHVATIHFRTKEWTIDAKDEAVIEGLAKAYAAYASRNRFRPKEPQGLRGRVVGYADPRRSAGPDNQALSSNRANFTWHYLLRHLVSASGVSPGYFDMEQVGGGVAPGARDVAADGPSAEGNVLSPFRKAEIYLSGQGAEPAAPVQPEEPVPVPDGRVKPPNLDEWNQDEWDRGDWHKFDKWIEAGQKREIEGMALRIGGWTVSEGSTINDALQWTATAAAVAGHQSIPPIRFVKPPWWDTRGAGLYPRVGRGGITRPQRLIYEAKLLKRDYIETAKWSEIHFSSKGSTYALLISEAKKDAPDAGKIEEYVKNLAYLRFMIDAVQNSAQALTKLAQ